MNPITALFDPIERLINEHGSAAILRDHVALFRDQLAILKDKFTVLESENETLKMENQNLTKQIQKLKEEKTSKDDTCPFCSQPKGKLMELKPHSGTFGRAGLKTGYYQCDNCGKKYDKQHKT